jgi:hypothetical protein
MGVTTYSFHKVDDSVFRHVHHTLVAGLVNGPAVLVKLKKQSLVF